MTRPLPASAGPDDWHLKVPGDTFEQRLLNVLTATVAQERAWQRETIDELFAGLVNFNEDLDA